MKRPQITPAFVLAAIALFVSLSGTAWAATGGGFLLGKPNTADARSTLTANIAGSNLHLANTSTTTGATALGLTVTPGHTPFTVNSTGKVTNLNADQLDGKDSSAFLPINGKAADAGTLDGIDSTGYVQGAAQTTAQAMAIQPGNLPFLETEDSVALLPGCPATPTTLNGILTIGNDTGLLLNTFVDDGSADPYYNQVADSDSISFPMSHAGESFTIQTQTSTSISVIHIAYVGRDTDCHFQYESTTWRQ